MEYSKVGVPGAAGREAVEAWRESLSGNPVTGQRSWEAAQHTASGLSWAQSYQAAVCVTCADWVSTLWGDLCGVSESKLGAESLRVMGWRHSMGSRT